MGIRGALEAEGSDTTRRILAAAAEEFAQRGYASARVRQIVDAARVNQAAVNYYFGGKEGLYSATLRHLASRLRSAPRNRRGQTPQERLYRQVFAMLCRFVGNKRASPLARILAHEAMNPTAHLEHLVEDMLLPELESVRVIVRELAGAAADDADVARAAASVMGQCLFFLHSRGPFERLHPELTRGADACARLARHVTDFSLAGIAGLGAARAAAK